jgi:succinate dehydrogenase / fumarate reductase cytochrome b subunit
MPYLPVLEWVMIYIPLAIHVVLGVIMIFEAKYNPVRYGYSRNWWFLFQRLSAVCVLFFIVWHVWTTRIQLMLGRVEVGGLYELMQAQFQDPFFLAIYVLGITSAALHFGNGLWGFLVSWGLLTSRRSQRVFAGLCIAVGALVLAGFVNVAYHYSSGSEKGGILPAVEGEAVHAGAAAVSTVEILD